MANAAPTLGSRIAGQRRTLKRTQQAVAKAVGIAPRTLSHFENDSRKPSWDVAVRLADELSTSLDYLAGRVEKRMQG